MDSSIGWTKLCHHVLCFLGLGAMGGNMAVNLVKKYPDLQVFDIVEENVQRVLAAGPTATGIVSLLHRLEEGWAPFLPLSLKFSLCCLCLSFCHQQLRPVWNPWPLLVMLLSRCSLPRNMSQVLHNAMHYNKLLTHQAIPLSHPSFATHPTIHSYAPHFSLATYVLFCSLHCRSAERSRRCVWERFPLLAAHRLLHHRPGHLHCP